MRKENSTIRTKFISEAGSQLLNADYFAFVELDNYACYCIADGIDNDKTKESARLVVSAVIDEFIQKPGMGKKHLKKYLMKAHQTLLHESGTFRLESSVLVIVTDYKKLRYANAGNARMYICRNGKVIVQSKDQSLSQNMAERGDIALDKIEEHEERHNLYCYAGQRGRFKPYVSNRIKLTDGDVISLMTCGIWENTGIAELLDSIEDAGAPEEVCTNMEEIILRQRLRNIQNYTFVCIYIDKVYLNPNKQRNQKLIKKILIPIAIAAVIALSVLIVSKVLFYQKVSSMWNNIELAVQDMAAGLDEEGNNNYEKAREIYEEFDSKSELSNRKVIQAKYYLNLLNYREAYIQGDNCSKRYIAACKIMTCLVGKKGYERVENDGVDNKVLMVSTLQMIDYDYVDKAIREDLINYKENFINEFELVKEEYKIYRLLCDAQGLFESEINSGNNEKNLIRAAEECGIIIYNFDGTEFEEIYNELKVSVAAAINDNVNLNDTMEEYDAFLVKVSSKLAYIKAKAYESKADNLVKAGNLTDAKAAYANAKDVLKSAGTGTYGGDISDLENKLTSVEQQVSDVETDNLNEETRTLLSQAVEKFEKKKFEEAAEICEDISDKLFKADVSTGIVYDDLQDLKKSIKYAQSGARYEKEAITYERQGDYSTACDIYEKAQNSYEAAGVSDKEQEMRKKVSEIRKQVQEMNTVQ